MSDKQMGAMFQDKKVIECVDYEAILGVHPMLTVVTCIRCGSVIINQELHEDFHAKISELGRGDQGR